MRLSTPDQAPTAVRLAVANELAALEPARLAVHGFLAGRIKSQRALYQLDLVLEESLMNRLWHAFPLGERQATRLEVTLHNDELVLQFEDEGVPFDPTLVTEPAVADALADAPSGGRGLLLTRKAARRWSYERRGDTNVFTVVLALD